MATDRTSAGFVGAAAVWLRLPVNLCRGLLRLYVVVTVPWVAWFGYQIFSAFQRHYQYGSFWRYASGAVWSVLILPIGGPILLFVIAWIAAGFRNSTKAPSQSEPPSHPSTVDYYSFLSRAVSDQSGDTVEARELLYERARSVLAAQLNLQNPPISSSQLAIEQAALELAIRKTEKDALNKERLIARGMKKPSTVLLIASMLFPGLWALDFTSMSVYWVARPPRGLPPQSRRSFV